MTTITYPCPMCREGKIYMYNVKGEITIEMPCYHCNGTGQLPFYQPVPYDEEKYRFTI